MVVFIVAIFALFGFGVYKAKHPVKPPQQHVIHHHVKTHHRKLTHKKSTTKTRKVNQTLDGIEVTNLAPKAADNGKKTNDLKQEGVQ